MYLHHHSLFIIRQYNEQQEKNIFFSFFHLFRTYFKTLNFHSTLSANWTKLKIGYRKTNYKRFFLLLFYRCYCCCSRWWCGIVPLCFSTQCEFVSARPQRAMTLIKLKMEFTYIETFYILYTNIRISCFSCVCWTNFRVDRF